MMVAKRKQFEYSLYSNCAVDEGFLFFERTRPSSFGADSLLYLWFFIFICIEITHWVYFFLFSPNVLQHPLPEPLITASALTWTATVHHINVSFDHTLMGWKHFCVCVCI